MKTIKLRVIADKVWHSTESRILTPGEIVEFPAEVKDYAGNLVPFKVGPSFEVVEDEPKAKAGKPKDGGNPAADLT